MSELYSPIQYTNSRISNVGRCNRLPVPQLSPPYPCFQLQSYLSSAAMVHRRRLRRRHRRHPIATYFMYIYHFISIDLESSRSCNSLPLQSLQTPAYDLRTLDFTEGWSSKGTDSSTC